MILFLLYQSRDTAASQIRLPVHFFSAACGVAGNAAQSPRLRIIFLTRMSWVSTLVPRGVLNE